MSDITFRPYRDSDRNACLTIFDRNCPEYFAPNERADYEAFLQGTPAEYQICERAGALVGAFGVLTDKTEGLHLNWILLDPRSQGSGIGRHIMSRVTNTISELGHTSIQIAASHKSAPFFEHFGAVRAKYTQDGWGPGMHRVDMRLHIS